MSQSIEIVDAKSPSKKSFILENVTATDTVLDVKKQISKKKNLGIDRIALRTEPRGKNLRDEQTVSSLSATQLYVRDLGPQIAWQTVFLFEYAGPLFVYPIFFLRPSFIYGAGASTHVEMVVKIALACHSFHYIKRLAETLSVHRFSNGTMPLMNLFKNCSYYWGFAAFMSYFINHPNYSRPFSPLQIYLGLAGFVISELGNFSIHMLLRNLRPAGSKERKVPYPNSNPLTILYNYVSCPNYTYEVAAWASFTIMTQCLPVAFFTLAGFMQMKIWAVGKHKNYKKEFSNYPKSRTPIIPFLC